MKIVIVEDDLAQADVLLECLKVAFPSVTTVLCQTESEFYAMEDSLRVDPPALIISDMMVRWQDAHEDMLPPPQDVVKDGYYTAGVRIQRRLAGHSRTSSVPVIIYTVLERKDLDFLDARPPNVFFVDKTDPVEGLLKLVGSLLAIQGPITKSRPDTARAKKVFVSYSHRDSDWLEELRITLRPDVRDGNLILWDDTMIAKGSEWRKVLASHIDSAAAAVLLVSRYFFASDFIAQDELPPLLDAARHKGLQIFWIAVSASQFGRSKLSQYQCANDPSRPLDSLSHPDQAKEWVRIAEVIHASLSSRPT